ncbi:MAG: hypothetical protein IJY59_05475 [Bacteroidaceae bacterium]|nr:hypothetical protein [Bacteroidaceae bacterium]
MSKKRSNINKSFMVFNAVLFIAVLITTFIFLYLSFSLKPNAERQMTYEGSYHIEIADDFSGESLSVYINDSLLVNRVFPDSLVQLDVKRFAEEHLLMIVDNATDNTTPFNLSKEGGKISVRKSGDEVIIEETSTAF